MHLTRDLEINIIELSEAYFRVKHLLIAEFFLIDYTENRRLEYGMDSGTGIIS